MSKSVCFFVDSFVYKADLFVVCWLRKKRKKRQKVSWRRTERSLEGQTRVKCGRVENGENYGVGRRGKGWESVEWDYVGNE